MNINDWTLLYKINNSRKWRAKCSCGKEFDVYKSNITSGKSKRCRGCQAKRQKSNTNLITHGLSKDNKKLYNVWCGIKRRCYNSNQSSFLHYGAKGIRMCDDWINSFESFYKWSIENGYKDGLEFDRIDSNGNYEPSNCRLIQKSENIRRAHLGKKKTNSHRINIQKSCNGWTDKDVSEILDKCLSGDYKAEELSAYIGVERHTLSKLVKNSGYETNWRKGRFTKEEVNRILDDSLTMGRKELIKKYNSNHETMSCIINKRGIYGTKYYL